MTTQPQDAQPRRTPLYPEHVQAGGRMVPFGDWLMPMEYPAGSLAEHSAVRTAVGVFDVSHMGRFGIAGPGAVAVLNRVLAGDLQRIAAGQAQYTALCTADGGVTDDLICYRISDDEVLLVPNASNAERVRETLLPWLPAGVQLVDRTAELAMIAVQGPASRELLARLGILGPELDYMSFLSADTSYGRLFLARSGYTGEHGYELLVPADDAGQLWRDLIAGGAAPAGLGARDILRLEMGYPLHGNDLAVDISALESGLSWVIGWDKPQFLGRDALKAERAEGRARALRGVQLSGRGVPRPGMAVVDLEGGRELGSVTSGTYSPTLRTGIALALLDPGVAVGQAVAVQIRGRAVAGEVVRTPFVESRPK